MKPNQVRSIINLRNTELASARVTLLMLVSFLAGVVVSAFWFHRPAGSNAENVLSAPATPAPVVQPAAPPPAPSMPVAPAPAAAAPPAPEVANPMLVDPAAIAEVKKLVPNFASISFEEGETILRAATLRDFAAATADVNEQARAAQQQLQDAQNGQSAADQQAAMKHAQDAQMAAADKLREIAARLQAQIAALKSLKNQP